MRNARLSLAGISTLLAVAIILPAFAQSSSSSSSSSSSESSTSSSVSTSSSSSVSSSSSSTSSSSSSVGQTYAQCVIAAINTRAAAWIAANNTYNAALTAAVNQLTVDLTAAVNAGQSLQKGPAFATYQQAVNAAAQALKASHRDANLQFNAAVKACGQLPGHPITAKKTGESMMDRSADKAMRANEQMMRTQDKMMRTQDRMMEKTMKKEQ